MTDLDIAYYQRRTDEENAAALAATEPRVAAINRDLARQYRALIAVPESRPLFVDMLLSDCVMRTEILRRASSAE